MAVATPQANACRLPSRPTTSVALSPIASIRAIEGAGGEVACARCQTASLATGPTAYLDDEPICDRCMLDVQPQLGMVLGLISVSRAYAAIEPEDEATRRHVAAALLSFARIYERFASRHGPARLSVVLERWLERDGWS